MANEYVRALRKSMTPHEVRLWVALRPLKAQGPHFRRQVPRAGYILDFACLGARLAIEIDGEHHGFETHLARDAMRDATLSASGFLVLRLWNREITGNLDGIVETIVHHARLRLTPRTSGSASG